MLAVAPAPPAARALGLGLVLHPGQIRRVILGDLKHALTALTT